MLSSCRGPVTAITARRLALKRAPIRNGGGGSVAFALCLLVSAPAPLFAYLDPGAGSMLVQVTIGAIAAGLTLCKLYWKKIAGFFRSGPED